MEKGRYKDKIYSIPGLSSIPKTKHPRKTIQKLLATHLKEKKYIVIWHDVLKNSISRNDSSKFQALTEPQLNDALKGF